MPAKPHGRHQNVAARRGRRRAVAWAATLAVPGLGVIAAACWLLASPGARTPSPARMTSAQTTPPVRTASAGITTPARDMAPIGATAPVAWPGTGSATAAGRPAASPALALWFPQRGGSDLVLSSQARQSCPPAASACADLRDHLTWLQTRGRITYGPVRMEPGGPADPTPRGIFHVSWKAGPHYISTSFGIPIPYAVFFAPGGIAFHAGSLTTASHGCVHLSLPSARYYHDHLPAGAEVAVF
jgi:L,D-transpeptidase catalytic domain